MTHTCKICSATSDTVEFYKGVTSRCKSCHKEKVRENRMKNAEHYRAYDAKRYQEDPRVRGRHKRYAQTEAGKVSLRKARAKWMSSNQDKRAAHIILGNAVRDGRANKPEACSVCGSTSTLHGHHGDYTKPLEVEWLCADCHAKKHR